MPVKERGQDSELRSQARFRQPLFAKRNGRSANCLSPEGDFLRLQWSERWSGLKPSVRRQNSDRVYQRFILEKGIGVKVIAKQNMAR